MAGQLRHRPADGRGRRRQRRYTMANLQLGLLDSSSSPKPQPSLPSQHRHCPQRTRASSRSTVTSICTC
uniref:Uncharacterized protein n=1 Tax=Setaria viridis TaxID=4556 RepID=A0A4U6V9X3_SETVI|nr:hypothetical protein SEVIR_3G165733v2 [Setaria viridis]